jgi:hypothetical protein
MSKDFVTFLVDETLKLQKSGEFELSSFELKLTDYGLDFLRGQFLPQLQVLHFATPFGDLDVPINWSVFSSTDHTLFEATNDPEKIFAIIKTAWNKPLEKLLIIHADGFCYLVGLKAGEVVHLHDLLNPQEWLKSA